MNNLAKLITTKDLKETMLNIWKKLTLTEKMNGIYYRVENGAGYLYNKNTNQDLIKYEWAFDYKYKLVIIKRK